MLTDVREKPSPENRNWADSEDALAELNEEGWIISGYDPNGLSEKLVLGDKYQGFGLMRTIH